MDDEISIVRGSELRIDRSIGAERSRRKPTGSTRESTVVHGVTRLIARLESSRECTHDYKRTSGQQEDQFERSDGPEQRVGQYQSASSCGRYATGFVGVRQPEQRWRRRAIAWEAKPSEKILESRAPTFEFEGVSHQWHWSTIKALSGRTTLSIKSRDRIVNGELALPLFMAGNRDCSSWDWAGFAWYLDRKEERLLASEMNASTVISTVAENR